MNARTWVDIGSDVNWQEYGGLWARKVDKVRYQVIRFENTNDWGESPGYRYHCDLSEVRLDSPHLTEARRCCDVDDEQAKEPLALVYAMHSYGCVAPLWQDGGNN